MASFAYRGGIAAAMSVMLMLSILMGAIPALGTLTAGIIGGRMAGEPRQALMAAVLPAVLLAILLSCLDVLLAGLPIIGPLAELGGLTLASVQVGTLLIGAVVGGLLHH